MTAKLVVFIFAGIGFLTVLVAFFRRQRAQGFGFSLITIYFITAELIDLRHSCLHGSFHHPPWPQESAFGRLNFVAAVGFFACVLFMRIGRIGKAIGALAGLILVWHHLSADPGKADSFAARGPMIPALLVLAGAWLAGFYGPRPEKVPQRCEMIMLARDGDFIRRSARAGLAAAASLFVVFWIFEGSR